VDGSHNQYQLAVSVNYRCRNMVISTDMKRCDSTFCYLQWKWSGGGRWHWCCVYWVLQWQRRGALPKNWLRLRLRNWWTGG